VTSDWGLATGNKEPGTRMQDAGTWKSRIRTRTRSRNRSRSRQTQHIPKSRQPQRKRLKSMASRIFVLKFERFDLEFV